MASNCKIEYSTNARIYNKEKLIMHRIQNISRYSLYYKKYSSKINVSQIQNISYNVLKI